MPLYPASTDAKSRIVSFFTRIGYTYKNKYLATFNLRADGSSKFAPGTPVGIFPIRISGMAHFQRRILSSPTTLPPTSSSA